MASCAQLFYRVFRYVNDEDELTPAQFTSPAIVTGTCVSEKKNPLN